MCETFVTLQIIILSIEDGKRGKKKTIRKHTSFVDRTIPHYSIRLLSHLFEHDLLLTIETNESEKEKDPQRKKSVALGAKSIIN